MDININSLFEGTLSKAIWAALSAGGSIVLAWLKRKGWPWAIPILYGFGIFALVTFSLIGLQIWFTPGPNLSERITTENIEGHVRNWLDGFGLGVQRQTDASALFEFVVSVRNGNRIVIERTRDRDRYLSIQGSMNVSPEHAAIIGKLSDAQSLQMFDEITLEMARSKIGFQVETAPKSSRVQSVIAFKGIPITEDLTGDILIRN